MATHNSSNLAVTQGMNASIVSGNYTLSNLRNGAKYVVSDTSGQGGYTSISAAISQAASDGVSSGSPATILVWPGSYTENLVLQDYINIASICGGVTVNGYITYPSGSASCILENISVLNSSSNPAFSLTSSINITVINCQLSSSSTGTCISASTGNIEFSGCKLVSSSDFCLSISGASISMINCSLIAIGTGCMSISSGSISASESSFLSIVTGSYITSGTVSVNNSKITDIFTVDTGTFNTSFCEFVAGSAIFITFTAAGFWNDVNSSLNSNDSSNNAVTGAGTVTLNTLTMTGSAKIINSTYSGYLTYAGFLSTSPAASGSPSGLSLGTAYQNPYGYDVVMTIYIQVSSSAGGNIKSGVGPTSTPTVQTVVSALNSATVLIIPVTVYLPNNYYALIETTGTIAAVISGRQVTPV